MFKAKELIKEILEQNPESRADDTLLYVECAKRLGATSLEDLTHIGLSIITVHKMRQVIQNKDGLFRPTDEIVKARREKDKEVRKQMREYNKRGANQ